MNKNILVIGLVVCFAFAFAIVGFSVISAEASAMPDNQCYKMASNKDKAVENMVETLRWFGNRTNPCTGELDTVNTYYELDGGVTHIRTVYGNGDTEGYLGLTHYLVCQDERAKVMQRIYGPRGYGLGFWYNFPFDDDPSTWIYEKEICNTM